MTPEQISQDLQIPKATLAQWRWLGRGPTWVKIGRHVRYPRVEYRAWLEARDRHG